MFAPERKKAYIDNYMAASQSADLKNYETYITNFFNRLEPHEAEIGKDFADMNRDEVVKVLTNFLSGSYTYQNAVKSLLSGYYDWSIASGASIHFENPLVSISLSDIDISESYANTMVVDEAELNKYLDEAFRDLSDESPDNIARCFVLLCYAGLSQEEAVFLREDDVDLSRKEIKIRKRTIPLSESQFAVIKHVMEATHILHNIKSAQREDEITKTGFVLENSSSLTKKNELNYRENWIKSLRVMVSRSLANCSKPITLTSITMSGIFNRMYLHEQATGEVSAAEYLHFKRANARTVNLPESARLACEEEYRMWKRAFDLN